MNKPKLSDIVKNSAALKAAWNSTRPAADAGLLPPGWYVAAVEHGELFASKNGTPGYKLRLNVLSPTEYTARVVFHDLWLTERALPATLLDLGKLGVTDPDQLDHPLPAGLVVRVRVATRTWEGKQNNEVGELHLHDAPCGEPPAAAAPVPPPAGPPAPWAADLDALDPDGGAAGDATGFDHGANAPGGGA